MTPPRKQGQVKTQCPQQGRPAGRRGPLGATSCCFMMLSTLGLCKWHVRNTARGMEEAHPGTSRQLRRGAPQMAGDFLSGARSTCSFGMLYCRVDLHSAFAIKTVSKRNKKRGKIKSYIKRVFCDLFMSNLWKMTGGIAVPKLVVTVGL